MIPALELICDTSLFDNLFEFTILVYERSLCLVEVVLGQMTVVVSGDLIFNNLKHSVVGNVMGGQDKESGLAHFLEPAYYALAFLTLFVC
jgi:hypothetical protein